MGSYSELKGKSVVVTGAGRGIGLAISRRFVQEGYRVMLADIKEGNSAEVISFAKRVKTKAIFRKVDVTSEYRWSVSIPTPENLSPCRRSSLSGKEP